MLDSIPTKYHSEPEARIGGLQALQAGYNVIGIKSDRNYSYLLYEKVQGDVIYLSLKGTMYPVDKDTAKIKLCCH